jgi:energy-coupling factor transporter transmembrane protein EcfT
VRLLVVPLVVSALHRSAQLAMVTELRGLQHRLGEVFAVAAPSPRDAVLPALTAAVVVAAAMGLA